LPENEEFLGRGLHLPDVGQFLAKFDTGEQIFVAGITEKP